MMLLIILLIAVALILIIRSTSKQPKETTKTTSIPIEVEFKQTKNKHIKGTFTPNVDGSVTLFNEGKSRVTLLGCTQEVAEKIINILDNSASFYESEKKIGAILMEKGIQIREVEEFLSKVRPIVQNRVDKLISKDSEWQTLGDKDKEYKLEEYMSESMVEFDEEVSPAMSVSLTHLTINAPTQVPLLQEIIMQYGVHNISTYCEHYGRKNPIIKISNANYSKPLEQLVEVGLAYTGKDMSIEELLSSLTLAELNEIAAADKKFTRKDKAIQFLAAKEDITSIIERHIALRSLFILIPLPEEFKEFDIEKYKVSLNYYNELACVLTSLYNGYSTMKYIK